MHLTIHNIEYSRRVVTRKGSCGAQRGLDVCDHERRRKAFAGGVSDGEGQALVRKGQKIVAITAERSELPATGTVAEGVERGGLVLHKPSLHIAGIRPVLTNVYHVCVGRHGSHLDKMSNQGDENRHKGDNFP
jgi:hypothetical protein